MKRLIVALFRGSTEVALCSPKLTALSFRLPSIVVPLFLQAPIRVACAPAYSETSCSIAKEHRSLAVHANRTKIHEAKILQPREQKGRFFLLFFRHAVDWTPFFLALVFLLSCSALTPPPSSSLSHPHQNRSFPFRCQKSKQQLFTQSWSPSSTRSTQRATPSRGPSTALRAGGATASTRFAQNSRRGAEEPSRLLLRRRRRKVATTVKEL